jgi:YjbR
MPARARKPLDANDFRRLALSFDGAEEGSHMGHADFRLGGRIFATLASIDKGFGNIKLTPEQQAEFCAELPDVFLPVAGGWGRGGMTHVRLGAVNEDVLAGALEAAWRLRRERNANPRAKPRPRPRPRKTMSRKTR